MCTSPSENKLVKASSASVMIETVHDFVHQSMPNPGNYGSIVHIESWRFPSTNSFNHGVATMTPSGGTKRADPLAMFSCHTARGSRSFGNLSRFSAWPVQR